MSNYIIKEKTETSMAVIIKENEDGSIISFPIDPANSDYQAYLNKDNPVLPIGGNE